MKQLEAFFWGGVGGFSALVVEVLFETIFSVISPNWITSNTITLVVLGVLIEESAKFFIINFQLSKESRLLLRSFIFGIGFAALEMALMNRAVALSAAPWLLAVHISAATVIGWFSLKKAPLLGLLVAFALHLAYNLSMLKLVN